MSRSVFVSRLLKRATTMASKKSQSHSFNLQRSNAISSVFGVNNNSIGIRRYSAPLNVSLASALEKLDSYKFDTPSVVSSLLDSSTNSTNKSIVELPHHEKTIGTELEGCYVRLGTESPDKNHYGTQDTVVKALSVAYAWSKDLKLNPIVMIGDINVKDVNDSIELKNGSINGKKYVDFGLLKTLPSDSDFPDSNADREAQLCALLIQSGAHRVLFNDPIVKDAVNQWAEKNKLNGRVDDSMEVNKNHFFAQF